MFSNTHNASITNFVADRGSDGMFFYTLAKYWIENHERPVRAWEADENQEFHLEVRSYKGPAPAVCTERKYTLTPPQYAMLLFEVSAHGPDAAHTYITGEVSSWTAATSTSSA